MGKLFLVLQAMSERIIILGSNGQIGTELAIALRSKYGNDAVITSDIREPVHNHQEKLFEIVDVMKRKHVSKMFAKHRPTQVFLLAAMLSATGEKYPRQAWNLNMEGLLNVMDAAIEHGVQKIFWPSSIAVFGPNSPITDTPQYTIMDPNTVYGISKLAGERLCEYYNQRYGLDIRSIRYPGIISWKAAPGGGTTDYAIHIFHEALRNGHYESFLSAETMLPMLYMEDAIRGTLQLMDAPAESLTIKSSYNLTGVSFTPEMLAAEIAKQVPGFRISYASHDPRQAIADSWPKSIDDSFARTDWGWQPKHDLASITRDMIDNLKKK